MHRLLIVCVAAFTLVLAQAGTSSGDEKPGSAKKHVLTIYEFNIAKAVKDPPSPERVATDYERLLKAGDCSERQSFQLTVWSEQEFQFARMADAILLDRRVKKGEKETRVMSKVKLGFELRGTLASVDGKTKLKFEYGATSVKESNSESTTSEIEEITVNTDVEIIPGKRLVIPTNSEGVYLLTTLLPDRAVERLSK